MVCHPPAQNGARNGEARRLKKNDVCLRPHFYGLGLYCITWTYGTGMPMLLILFPLLGSGFRVVGGTLPLLLEAARCLEAQLLQSHFLVSLGPLLHAEALDCKHILPLLF